MACNYIGKQKGRSGVAPLGVLLGAIGFLIVAFMKPAPNSEDPDAPQRPQGRLDWLSHSGGRAWTSRPELLWSVVVLAVSGFALFRVVNHADEKLNGSSVETVIQKGLTDRGIPGSTVTCPATPPSKKGAIFDCSATDSTGTVAIRVTVDDSAGHFTWQPQGPPDARKPAASRRRRPDVRGARLRNSSPLLLGRDEVDVPLQLSDRPAVVDRPRAGQP